MTQKEIFFKRLKEKRANGLLSMDFYVDQSTTASSEEELYAELNRMDQVECEPDLELFPTRLIFK